MLPPAAEAAPPWGNGQQWPDMRYPIRRVGQGGRLSDAEVEFMLAIADRFCQQIVEITAAALDTVSVGEVRQLVASEMAPTGAMSRRTASCASRRTRRPQPLTRPNARVQPATH